MLRRFSFENGQVSFANRFLQSQAYQEAKEKGKISRGEFGIPARHSLWERLSDPLPRLTDNATVNITVQGDRFASVTESPFPIVFDPETLGTIGQFAITIMSLSKLPPLTLTMISRKMCSIAI